MRTLNLGILAHVDAGKTTLTERLLYDGRRDPEIGSVDQGTTQTDTLELERERGITIKSAVASFAIDDLTVNILDTPGHPDFIAEVERVLRVLDGAILVVSAVEGIQPQTPLLYRALERLRVPTLLFLNKLDRRGASLDRTLEQIARRLTPGVVPMGVTDWPRLAQGGVPPRPPRRRGPPVAPCRAPRRAGRGPARGLRRGPDPLPAPARRPRGSDARRPGPSGLPRLRRDRRGRRAILEAPPSCCRRPSAIRRPPSRASVQDRAAPSGERVAYVRLSNGTDLPPRDQIAYGDGHEGRVTALAVYGCRAPPPALPAAWVPARSRSSAGSPGIRVGDPIGAATITDEERQFPPPALGAVVAARKPAARGACGRALNELAEQDPLINVRQDDERGEISVSLYGEVQRRSSARPWPGTTASRSTFHDDDDLHRAPDRRRGARVINSAEARQHQRQELADEHQPVQGNARPRIEPARPAAVSSASTSTSSSCRSTSSTRSRSSRPTWAERTETLEMGCTAGGHRLRRDPVRLRLHPNRLDDVGLPAAHAARARRRAARPPASWSASR